MLLWVHSGYIYYAIISGFKYRRKHGCEVALFPVSNIGSGTPSREDTTTAKNSYSKLLLNVLQLKCEIFTFQIEKQRLWYSFTATDEIALKSPVKGRDGSEGHVSRY